MDGAESRPRALGRCTEGGETMKIGIYGIRNSINGFWYVGQAKCIEIRQKQHFYALEHKAHTNIALQMDYNTHGAANFEFNILEEVPVRLLNSRETKWIQHLKSFTPQGYNLTKGSQKEKIDSVTLTKLQYEQIKRELSEKHVKIAGAYWDNKTLVKEEAAKIMAELDAEIAKVNAQYSKEILEVGQSYINALNALYKKH